MSAQRFSIGKQFQWQDKFYEVKRLLADSRVNIQAMESGEMQTVSFVTLLSALFEDELQFVEDGRPYQLPSPYIDLADCPPHLVAEARHRLSVIQPFLDLAPIERTTTVRQYVKKQKARQEDTDNTEKSPLSFASIYRWLKLYQDSGQDIRSLIPNMEKCGGRQKPRLNPEVEQIIHSVIEDHYYVREKRTINFLLRELAVRIEEENHHRPTREQLKMPSRATLDRRISVLDIEGKLIAKRGRLAARRALTQYGQGPRPTMPLERVEIDHTKIDLMVVDDKNMRSLGRPTFTYCIDVATRYPLGYYIGFEPPSYLTVMECLYHAIQPKEGVRAKYDTEHEWLAHGIPSTLIVDNGKEFIGRDLQDACQLLGITLERMPVRMPEFKGVVERMFGTLNTGLFHTLPGTTFSNIGQRGDYQSLKEARLTLDTLDKILHLFLLDIYAEDMHSGLQDIPACCWEEATRNGFFPRVPASGEELRILLGRVAYRTVQRYGIELNNVRYNCSELALLRTRMKHEDNKQVKVKYHPGDLGQIYAFDPFEKRYIEVPALDQEYLQGLSLWKYRVIRSFNQSKGRTVDLPALGHAQRKIQEEVDQSLISKKLKNRSRIARWQASGHISSLAGEGSANSNDSSQELESLELSSINLEQSFEELEQVGWGLEQSSLSHNGRKQND